MANTTTKFGFGQILADTPKWASWAFRIVLYLAMATILIVTSFTEIPAPVVKMICKMCGEIVIVVHGLTRMFGIEIKDPPAAADEITK